MLDFLAYAIVILVFCALWLELLYCLRRSAGERFVRAVGIAGLSLVGWSYYGVAMSHAVGMPTSTLRPGIFLIVAYIVARNIYDYYRR